MSTTEKRTEDFDAGVAEAEAALRASDKPIFLEDEVALDLTIDAYAMGWNSVCAGEENRQRWANVKQPSSL
ncbi:MULTISPECIES: hypothetical protein [unclassified Burkholderia]|uniref:hypothetical protein n=1 Tax=unclassified Burkholderia TaxID=2613784 RepID=UPI0014246268|nr:MULTISPECIES: hypothetical protein [unclassified Burkholderia]NIE81962.1 hypothetical protein [Burkholderia sp. Tr-860]NIF61738.1 hypothetical protein [Burkholderia sp. Cy-647]NIF94053.1 hypothetical protein [Burkholderia sp. Ax-1720]